MPTPEEAARPNIDALLQQCGWTIQDYKRLALSAGPGIAIREVRLEEGRCDYLLLIDRKPVGIIEAKKAGVTLSTVADQSGRYAENLPDFLRGNLTGKLPFLYESTGVETYFRDERDPHPRSRRVFAFHRPETLADWLGSAGAPPAGFGAPPNPHPTLRGRLAQMPFAHPYDGRGVRVCRVEAISGLEQSFAEARPRALIQMATGAGKTHPHRLRVHLPAHQACRRAQRPLPRRSRQSRTPGHGRLEQQRQDVIRRKGPKGGAGSAKQFQQFVTPDGRKFTELFNVQHLTSNKLDGVCRVTICTIQRLYAMLRSLSSWLNKRSHRANSCEETGRAWCEFVLLMTARL